MQTGLDSGAPRARLARLRTDIVRNWEIYLLISAAIVWYVVFCYFPMGGLSLAFKDYKGKLGIWDSPWSGWKNFEKVFKTPMFSNAFFMTLWINLMELIFCFPVPVILALMLNELRMKRYKKGLQTVFTFPNFLSWVIVGSIIKNLLAADGTLNSFLSAIGAEPVSILGSKPLFRPLLYISGIWKSAGWSSIIYLAAISGIDASQYEAAEIDGASRWQRVRHITLANIFPTVSVMLILAIGGMMGGNFDKIYNLQNDIVASQAETLAMYIYRITFERKPDYGFSTAVSLFCSVVNMTLMIVANAASKKLGGSGLIGDVSIGH